MGGWGAGAAESARASARLREIRDRGKLSIYDDFRKTFGPEIAEDWRRKGFGYKRRDVSIPDDPEGQLVFSFLCGYAFNLWDWEGWGFPSEGEIREMMLLHKEEIRNMSVVVPSYTALVFGLFDFVLRD